MCWISLVSRKRGVLDKHSTVVNDHTVCDVCEQPAVSSGSKKLAAIWAELQASEPRSIALNSSYSLQRSAMKQKNACLQP